jgi:hypothetical protein
MNLGIRFPPLLITILSVGVWSYSQAIAQVAEEDYSDANTVAQDAASPSAATSTVYTWSTTTTGFAWLNATHWSGNPGHYPGVDAAPGVGTTPGTLTTLSRVTFAAASSYKADANSTAGKADKLVAKGVTINTGAQFFFSDHGSGTLSSGTVLTLISNTATTAISGRFANLAEGLTFTNGANTYQVSYHGGDSNDLTLTVQ